MKNKRMLISVIYVLLGTVLFGCGLMDMADEFWSGLGGALIGVGSMYLMQSIRYQKNPEYRENVDTERNDERNRFLSMKAWQLTGGWFVIIAAVGTFIFKFAGREDLMMLSSGAVCLMIFMYWIFFLYLRKKF